MKPATAMSVDEYLSTRFEIEPDYVDGELRERYLGSRQHGRTQFRIALWFETRRPTLKLIAIPAQHVRISASRYRIPDLCILKESAPKEKILSTPPHICVEILSEDDTVYSLEDRIDDLRTFGVPNIWIIDPERGRGWSLDTNGSPVLCSGILTTNDGLVAMPMADVLPD